MVPQTQKTDTHKRKSPLDNPTLTPTHQHTHPTHPPLDTTDGNLLLSEFDRQFSMRKKRARLEKDFENGNLPELKHEQTRKGQNHVSAKARLLDGPGMFFKDKMA